MIQNKSIKSISFFISPGVNFIEGLRKVNKLVNSKFSEGQVMPKSFINFIKISI